MDEPRLWLALFGMWLAFGFGWLRRAAERPVGGHGQTWVVTRDDRIVVLLRYEDGGAACLGLEPNVSRRFAKTVLGIHGDDAAVAPIHGFELPTDDVEAALGRGVAGATERSGGMGGIDFDALRAMSAAEAGRRRARREVTEGERVALKVNGTVREGTSLEYSAWCQATRPYRGSREELREFVGAFQAEFDRLIRAAPEDAVAPATAARLRDMGLWAIAVVVADEDTGRLAWRIRLYRPDGGSVTYGGGYSAGEIAASEAAGGGSIRALPDCRSPNPPTPSTKSTHLAEGCKR